jgi:uncharacterized Zn finger protein
MANDQQGLSREHVQRLATPNCPHCQMTNGQPIEVEEGRGYRRVTYRCGKCQHVWAQTSALAQETPLR